MRDRYLLTTTKNGSVTEQSFPTFKAIAEHIGTSLNTTRQIFAYTQGEVEKPRRSIRTKNMYDTYSITEVVPETSE